MDVVVAFYHSSWYQILKGILLNPCSDYLGSCHLLPETNFHEVAQEELELAQEVLLEEEV
jgi:hypothetical protein